jgi:sugar (glycoside-pentoside-hexuronide) transporter
MQSTAEKLSVGIKTGWAIGELGIATYVGITMIYLMFFLTEGLGISPFWAGIALLIPRLWDVVTDPVMGAISDRTHTRMGRRRPYLLIGGALFGIAFFLIFAAPTEASEMTKVVYVTAAYMLTSTAYTIYEVPYGAMAAEMSADYRERTVLTGYKMMAARIGIVIAVTLGPYIYTSQETLAGGFRLLGGIFGGFMVITALISFFSTARAPRIARVVHAFSLKDEFRAIVRNRPFAILFMVFLLQNIAIGASATTLVYYLTVVMKVNSAVAGQLFAVGAITATVVTPAWVYLTRNIEKKTAYFAGLAIAAAMALPALFLPPNLYYLLFAILFFAGIGDAAHQLFSLSMVADTVEVGELDTGMRREGAIFGAWAFCLKLGMALGAFFVSIGLNLAGYTAGSNAAADQSEHVILTIRVLYSLLPFVLWLLAILILRAYDLDEKRFNAVKSAIKSS